MDVKEGLVCLREVLAKELPAMLVIINKETNDTHLDIVGREQTALAATLECSFKPTVALSNRGDDCIKADLVGIFFFFFFWNREPKQRDLQPHTPKQPPPRPCFPVMAHQRLAPATNLRRQTKQTQPGKSLVCPISKKSCTPFPTKAHTIPFTRMSPLTKESSAGSSASQSKTATQRSAMDVWKLNCAKWPPVSGRARPRERWRRPNTSSRSS